MSEVNERNEFGKYLVLQVTTVPSLLCDILILIHFIRHWKKEIVESSHNHAFVYLILASCIQKSVDVPFLLHYLRWGFSLLQNSTFCLAWCWIDYSLISCLLHMLAWFSIERHLFVFHHQWMKKKSSLLLFHYVPLVICSVYAPLFYLIVIFFPSKCANTWIYSEMFCGGACYVYNDPVLSTFDWLFHYATPVLIIFLANILLFLRVVWRKLALGQPIDWRRQRWMILQLVYLSTLCLVLQGPATIIGVIQMLWLPTFAYDVQTNYLFYITYFLYQFLPIVIMTSLPGFHKDIRQCIRRIERTFGNGPRVYPAIKQTGRGTQRETTVGTA